MRRCRRTAGALALAVALAAASPGVHAVLADETPASTSDQDFAAGKAAVEHKQWDEAVRSLRRALVRHPDNADLHNYLGYAHRNLKQLDLAFEHYRRAIALEPRHRGAHEYIGEAYLMVGDLPAAEKHLQALREICLLPCEELDDLEKAVARHRAGTRAAPAGPR
jgi:Flp pilus assembly protein TadD